MKKTFLLLFAVFMVITSFRHKNTNKPGLKFRHTAVPAAVIVSATKKSVEEEIYSKINFGSNILDQKVFDLAYTGFHNLQNAGKISADAHIITVCDFSKSSNSKRMWIIDLHNSDLLFNNLVAHGKNTGEEFAQNFSNQENSLQSSLGFYVTEDTYTGDNGYSLKLNGMDKGFNDNALQRSIVMHGADYVSEDFAKTEKRIGRSWGCPAVPRALAEPIINKIKGGSVVFIYYPDKDYLESSTWLKTSKN